MERSAALTARARVVRDIALKEREIARLQQDIARISRDVANLHRLLRSLEREGVASEVVERSTSTRILLVEQLVLRRLDRNHPRPTSSNELWPLAKGAGVVSRSTFRSQLHRLAEKGLIISAGTGQWKLAAGVIIQKILDPRLEIAIKQLQDTR